MVSLSFYGRSEMEMTWNNRLIRTEDGTLFFAEVNYTNGKPVGYTTPCLVGDDVDEMRRVLVRLNAALDQPIVNEGEMK
jgi:hypothetical protein